MTQLQWMRPGIVAHDWFAYLGASGCLQMFRFQTLEMFARVLGWLNVRFRTKKIIL